MTVYCTVCGYVHDGDGPPDVCPVCGADKSRFAERRGNLRLKIEGD